MQHFSGKFRTGYNGGTKVCYYCGKRTQAGIIDHETGGTELCRLCFDMFGQENAHSDGAHENRYERECPDCNPAVRTKWEATIAAQKALNAQRLAAQQAKDEARAAKEAARLGARVRCTYQAPGESRPCGSIARKGTTPPRCGACQYWEAVYAAKNA